MTKMISLNRTPQVDSEFLLLVEQALNDTVRRVAPSEVFVVQIDGWFDAKWRGFSGTTLHEIAIWRGNLTLPPFHPSRVLDQIHLVRSQGHGYEPSSAKPLHISQSSAANLRRLIADVSSSAVFLWYSTTNENADRASLMIYSIAENEPTGWYAGFRKNGAWRLTRSKGSSRVEIEAICMTKHERA